MPKPPGSSGKAKVLFLSPESPYPVLGGGPLRSASILEYLAGRFEVHAVVFRQPGDSDPGNGFPPGRIHKLDLVDLPEHSKHHVARVMRNAGRFIRNAPP